MTLIVVAALFFALGVVAVIGLAAVATNYKLKRKEYANAVWIEPVTEKKTGRVKKEGYWRVTGRYLAVAQDIERRLKSDSSSVKYDRIK